MNALPTQFRGYRKEDVDAFLDRCVGLVDLPPGRQLSGIRPTAEEVENVTFRMGLRGYAMAPVDDLLDQIVAALKG